MGEFAQTYQFSGQALYDMHMHLGFFGDPLRAACELEQSSIAALCATVTPGEFEQLQAIGLDGVASVRLGVGLHPWWIADGRCGDAEVQKAALLAADTRFIAEIGLDFGGSRGESRGAQIAALDAVLEACENGGHVLSVHAVQSADTVLDLLDTHSTCTNNEAIFHWFSGSGTDLTRAIKAGCYFSVNARMLSTRRGRAYAQQIPAKQLLIETDLPSSAEAELSIAEYAEQLEQTARILCDLRGKEILPTIAETSTRLLSLPH